VRRARASRSKGVASAVPGGRAHVTHAGHVRAACSDLTAEATRGVRASGGRAAPFRCRNASASVERRHFTSIDSRPPPCAGRMPSVFRGFCGSNLIRARTRSVARGLHIGRLEDSMKPAQRRHVRIVTGCVIAFVSLALQSGCMRGTTAICLGPEQCTLDKDTGHEVCRCASARAGWCPGSTALALAW
jgi:hypothetical protein